MIEENKKKLIKANILNAHNEINWFLVCVRYPLCKGSLELRASHRFGHIVKYVRMDKEPRIRDKGTNSNLRG